MLYHYSVSTLSWTRIRPPTCIALWTVVSIDRRSKSIFCGSHGDCLRGPSFFTSTRLINHFRTLIFCHISCQRAAIIMFCDDPIKILLQHDIRRYHKSTHFIVIRQRHQGSFQISPQDFGSGIYVAMQPDIDLRMTRQVESSP